MYNYKKYNRSMISLTNNHLRILKIG